MRIFDPKKYSFSVLAVPPVCMPRGVKVYGVAKMETAHIACRVEANPPQVAFRWTFNNSAEAKQGRPTDLYLRVRST